ncbi:hypothetical protein OG455_41850 [Kitasatospora sp. NBC_01287]|uniref:hypothetical protein n=1 Tax=Kitasatospora sp. NBC_01287 TaxID=2903573 RepID=UPI0022538B27|nr:hypothetical protein [Kitasatospora sp. NBC_01287]MCX4751719.1 hypothetical protein [Kitasatospora sp. NBC_01287]MCX4751989.1 hypothetical protein [Kitasatospora sp. NBC_01287]
MRAALGMGGYLAATLGTAALLLGKWIRKPAAAGPTGPLGLVQAFAHCPTCASVQPHIVHDTTCRRCTTCGHSTYAGDL